MAFIILLGLVSCRKKRVINTSFYYWKTVYDANATERRYFNALHCQKLYVRVMDVDKSDNGVVPISPVTFKSALPNSVQLIPVVYLVNDVLKNQTSQQLDDLARKIVYYVNGRIKPSGKTSYNELQIDCDWTRTTRDNYFYLLTQIRANASLKNKKLSATLRLHQLKNQKNSGIPPVNRVMLMCYNMGNLRKYGHQNSILEQSELEKYAGKNLGEYPMPIDVGLPVFNWVVVFRQKQYAGIAKRLHNDRFFDNKTFKASGSDLYTLQKDLPQYGLLRGDEIRRENLSAGQLLCAASYIQKYISSDTVNIIYFHLDEPTLKHYTYEDMEKTAAVFR
ncbi:hypothetical protein ACFQ3S_16200 [Mucilaginibacter terrae]|uniref:hypothetical protein n=1 Tax=Mucilaginibacter terrae TaxID=1955052 RepID=UPI003642586D